MHVNNGDKAVYKRRKSMRENNSPSGVIRKSAASGKSTVSAVGRCLVPFDKTRIFRINQKKFPSKFSEIFLGNLS